MDSRKEFEAWWDMERAKVQEGRHDTKTACELSWQACQAINDARITKMQAEHDSMCKIMAVSYAKLEDTNKKLLDRVRASNKHIEDWWHNFGEGGSQLPPAHSHKIVDENKQSITEAEGK